MHSRYTGHIAGARDHNHSETYGSFTRRVVISSNRANKGASVFPSLDTTRGRMGSTLTHTSRNTFGTDGNTFNASYITSIPNDAHKTLTLLHPNLFKPKTTAATDWSLTKGTKTFDVLSASGKMLKGRPWPGKSMQLVSYQHDRARAAIY